MNSLRMRLLLAAGAILLVFVSLTGLALERAFARSALQAESSRLAGLVYGLLGATEITPDGAIEVRSGALPDQRLLRPQSGLYAAVLEDGIIRWHSPSLLSHIQMPSEPAVGQWHFSQTRMGSGETVFIQALGVRWLPENGQPLQYSFMVAEGTATYAAQLAEFRRLWLWLIAAALLLWIGLLVVLRWGLAPLRRLARQLRGLEETGEGYLGGDHPEELQPLVANLNALLRNARQQQSRYRNALDDLAHSLKTPLSVLRGLAERQQDDGDQQRQIEEQVQRIRSIVDYQAGRAAAAGRRHLSRPIAVAAIVEKLVRSLRKVYADKNLNMETRVNPSLRLRVDEGDLTELLGNLLDNACKWADTRLRVSLSADAELIVICVEDDGPGIPPGSRETILARGVRADTRAEGQGIGLAVVREITEAAEGTLTIGESELGGAKITLRLPRD